MRFLVVDDDRSWHRRLPRALKSLSPEARIDVARSAEEAARWFQGAAYDLAVVDLALLGKPPEGESSDELGFELAKQLRNSRDNRHCGLIVITAYPSSDRILEALKRHAAHDFIEKDTYQKRRFLDSARQAIRDSRFLKIRERLAARFRLEITLDGRGFVGARLSGPKRANFPIGKPVHLDIDKLVEMADRLNLLVLDGGRGDWRSSADQLGRALFKALNSSRPLANALHSALSLPARESDLCLHFRGPASTLAVPFELMKDGSGAYICFKHLLTRESDAGAITRKTERFDQVLERLIRSGEPLRILVVGANADGKIPAATEEAVIIEQQLEKILAGLGILHEVVLLVGAMANYETVTQTLREERFHLFHYAGHGRYDDEMPEISGLVLPDQGQLSILRATDLNLLLKESELQFVYLSCCLGARTADRMGRGDFSGVFDALAQADVPAVLGYRWTVLDDSALAIAVHFYRELWRTLSPPEALLAARRQIATGEMGWDDNTWASPVLLSQNS